MTNEELLTFLYELEPESKEQDDIIKKMMALLISCRNKNTVDSINKYLEPVLFDEIVDKCVSDIYDDYVKWCNDNNYTPESKIQFSKQICYKFNVKTKTARVNGICKKVYKFY